MELERRKNGRHRRVVEWNERDEREEREERDERDERDGERLETMRK